MLRRVFCWPGRADFKKRSPSGPVSRKRPPELNRFGLRGAGETSSLLRFAGRGPWNRTEEDMSLTRRTLIAAAAAAAFGATLPAAAAEKPSQISLDYAYYNPVSLVLKNKGWVEEEFAKDGIGVRWVLSLGSNKALEFLSSQLGRFRLDRGRRGPARPHQRQPDQVGLHLLQARMDGARHAHRFADPDGRGPQGQAHRRHARHRSLHLPLARRSTSMASARRT